MTIFQTIRNLHPAVPGNIIDQENDMARSLCFPNSPFNASGIGRMVVLFFLAGLILGALPPFQGTARATIYYQDSDNDGYGNPAVSVDQATQPVGYVTNSGDCNDSNRYINPSIIEICGDGIDQNCSGSDNLCTDDGDGDGFTETEGDCNDDEGTVHPRATEICADDIDQDCEAGDKPCRDSGCLEIINYPIESQFRPTPPIVMLLLDNSGSMDWSILTTEENGGLGSSYEIFTTSDNAAGPGNTISGWTTGKWKARWHGENQLFYNPNVTYEPWPDSDSYTNLTAFTDPDEADPHTVRSHPVTGTATIDLDAQFQTVADAGIDAPVASYYAMHDNWLYLVTMTNGSIRYFKSTSKPYWPWTDEHTFVEVTGSDIPNITTRTYLEERQNFANYITFHRKRNFIAIQALCNLLRQMSGFYVGTMSINHGDLGLSDEEYKALSINIAPVPVGVDGENRAGEIIDRLYAHKVPAAWGTPLREGLDNLGWYLDDTDTNEIEELGDSPYLSEVDGGSCQQTFTVMITDGYWSQYDTVNVGDVDEDGKANTLADVALHYWDNDLSDLDNLVPTNNVDFKRTQHMVTYGIAFGITGLIDPDDYPDCPQNCEGVIPNCDDCPSNWGNPFGYYQANNKAKADNFYKATINGRGKIYSAYNIHEFNAAITQLQEDLEFASGTGSSLGVKGTQVATGTTIFQPSYQSEIWTGDVKAYNINADTNNLNTVANWSAADELAEDLEGANWFSSGTGRKIITNVGNTAKVFNTGDADDLDMTDNLINYIRGDDSLEGSDASQYRQRQDPLGDIIHSSPVPKNGLIFVGANDGMLHAFDDSDGSERFAYIPSFVHGNLPELTRQDYLHHYFVDATPYAKDIDDDTTYLVGGLGKGGKGVYCLDISESKLDPDSESDAKNIFKWIYPTATDNDMGFTYSTPYIVNSKVGWVVIFGNGYNSPNGKACLYVLNASTGALLKKINTQIGGTQSNCNGLSTPALIDVDRDGKVDYAYAGDLLGNMWKFDLTDDDADNWKSYFSDASDLPRPLIQVKNRLSQTQPITTKPDVIQVCDPRRKGYMVVFATGRFLGDDDFSNNDTQSVYGIWDWSDDWKANGTTASQRNTKYKYMGHFRRKYSQTQPRYLSSLKSNSTLPNSARTVTLVEQTELAATGTNARVLTNLPINLYPVGDADSTTQYHVGWYFDLAKTRERVFQGLIVRDRKAIFVSSIPSRSACLAGGFSYLYEINACNGGRTANPTLDINNDQVVDAQDVVTIETQVPNPGGQGSVTQTSTVAPSAVKFNTLISFPVILGLEENMRERKFFSTSSGAVSVIDEAPERTGVYYWRERD